MSRFVLAACLAVASTASAQTVRVPLSPKMITSSSELASFAGLADEQELAAGSPPRGKPAHGWDIPSQHWQKFPFSAVIDLGQNRPLATLWYYDTHGIGKVEIAAEIDGKWKPVAAFETDLYMAWNKVTLDVSCRRLRLTLLNVANITEIALDEYTPAGYGAMVDRKLAEAKLRGRRDQALVKARSEAAMRPWVELPPFGRVQVVDEVDCGAADPGHQFRESPAGVSKIETILGRPCRVLRPTAGEAVYMTFRLGRWKLLRPGGHYVLAVEYPEDKPRAVLVMNGGNETSRGFHTGTTLGDALHSKYVSNHCESLQAPLSGRYENWTLYFNLHDRFPDLEFLRGAKERKLTAEDGFDVAIAQFASENDPTSQGAAVCRIRLLEIPDPKVLVQPVRLPKDLPRRQIFWREEMADGVIESDKENERGLKDRLDWYRFKANQMRLLGIRTFCKDLLEFGACQHWDPTPHGGNAWVHFAGGSKDLWGQIVALMGREGFSVLPYYEYAGSKGDRGLGYQRRAKPLTRDDAYTHIAWIESANADLTDPDALADFEKMLDLTVLKLKAAAPFEGVWLRPRSQLPMSFSDAARGRFAKEANRGNPVTRAELTADKKLLARYEAWWFGKRREFLIAVRDYLRKGGIEGAQVLYTTEAGEPGTGFPTWEKRLVADDVAAWKPILARPEHIKDNRPYVPLPLDRVVKENLYLEALQAAPLNWGNWEVHHASPPADPARYRDTPGVMLTHCFNRRYTVASPKTLAAFRGPTGLAIVRHYALNENMINDKQDKPKLGYFVCDIERAGPACMMAEALAVANGDPTMIGYLMGNNFGRGFPQYVREFNANFLALPALPSVRLEGVAADPEVVVRQIKTDGHGTYYAVVNTGSQAKTDVVLKLPDPTVIDAVTGKPSTGPMALYPYQLRALQAK